MNYSTDMKAWPPELRSFEMVETVTVRNLPQEFSGTYETKGVFNVVQNRFTERGAFPKQTQRLTQQFKAFAETPGR